jgi:cell division protein FtsI/penicillin-binding protein 2
MGSRIAAVTILASILYALLILNVYNIQVVHGGNYKAQAEQFYEITGILAPERGNIYFTDRDGGNVPAAITKEYPIIIANPKEIAKAEQAEKISVFGLAETLASITGRNADDLKKTLSNSSGTYIPILRKAADNQIDAINSQNLPGVSVGQEKLRYYPLGSIASQLLGFVSFDQRNPTGKYGLELYYNDILAGKPGATEGDKIVPGGKGDNLQLTIDANIQNHAESVLDKLVSDFRGTGGTVIVANPKSGAILAMASTPSFDPNNYSAADIKNFMNPAVQRIYEPGSIFKVITMSAALDAGKVTPDTTYIDTGSITVSGKTIKNWDMKAHGKMTMTEVIENSLNTGAAFAEKQLGNDAFYNYLQMFGFKEKTGIDLPGEVVGSLAPLEKDKRDVNFATASFGQGVSATPIRLLEAIGAVANGGVMMRPYVNADLSPQPVRRVISEDASRKMVQMMIAAVDNAEIAHINGYTVAGKTGTAQVPDLAHGGYYADKVIDSYVGFAPAYNPRFIVFIKLDEPAGSPLAGLTVVPAFRDIASFILNYYNVPPDNVKN